MKLIDRQIEAVKKSLELWKRTKRYLGDCPCCDVALGCAGCPVYQATDFGCDPVIYKTASFEDIAGFLQSLLISLEEMK